MLALYFITPVFYYIPSAVLPAVIIVSISDLVTRYPTFIEFWNVSFFEFLVTVTGLLVTLFSTIEIGLYTSIALAVVILIVRIARPHLAALGKLASGAGHYVCLDDKSLDVNPPPSGILIFRIEESLSFPNASYLCEKIIEHVREHTIYGGEKRANDDLLWCDETNDRLGKHEAKLNSFVTGVIATSRNESATTIGGGGEPDLEQQQKGGVEHLGRLKAVIFDFSAVNTFDATAHQTLFDLRKLCSKHAGRLVHFHFVSVKPHLKRVVSNFVEVPLEVSDIIPLFNHGKIKGRG